MSNEIYRANDVQLRQQIQARLNALSAAISAAVSDDAYNEATWNGVTTIAPSKNAVRDKIELVSAKAYSEIFTVDVAAVDNTDYVLWYDAPFPGTIDTVRTKSASGTCTLTGKINTTALGGTANSVSSTAQEQAHASANTFVKGDKIQFTVSSNSSCINMAVAFYMTRTD